MAQSTFSFIRPEHIAPIRSLSLRARHVVEGLVAGMHRSPYHGFSAEFMEYRPYRTGEPARRIDWRKYAKTERSVVRLFEDETNLYARLILDKSKSMQMKAAGPVSKFEYARTLGASLAWVLIRQHDAVGLTLFDNRVDDSLPPRSTNRQLKTIIRRLEHARTGGTTRCGEALDTIARTIRRRGLTVLISDLMDDPESILTGLRHLRFKRQEIMVIQVLDPLECAFDAEKSYRLQDMESGRVMLLDGVTAAQMYSAAFGEHIARIDSMCREYQIELTRVRTTEPFAAALLRILDKRRRLF